MIRRPPFPAEDDVDAIADWAELEAIATHKPLSRGKLRTTLMRENSQNVSMAEDVWSELQRRRDLLGLVWPLSLDSSLRCRPEVSFPVLYVFLAALGLRYNIDGFGGELFEHCVAQLVTGLTGTPGMRLGFPRRNPLPKALAKAIELYCSDSVEELGSLKPLSSDKDLGLDVTTWRSFDDRRGGYLHYVGQCATGINWADKLTELNVNKWMDYVSWSIPPVRFFATPFVLRHEEFRRHSKDGGLILDRPRLLMLEMTTSLNAELAGKVKQYCKRLYP